MSDDDDDWFERALSDDEDDASGEPSESEDATDSAGSDASDLFEDSDADDDGDGDGPFEGDSADADPFGEPESDTGGESPFGDDGGTQSPWGDAGGGESPFSDDDGGELFDESFGSAFDAGSDEEFDDEDFESDIPRIDLGIEGLDDMIQGGIPHKHLIVTIGSAGTGKTTFGLQFLHHGLENGENSVFITLEQSKEAIMSTANERGWEFDRYEAENRLAVVDLDPVEMANSLDNIRGELPELIREFDADRIVLDSVSLLEMMYDEQARRRTQVFDFTRSLKEADVTTFLTSEASEANAYASRHGIIEYLTDAVFVLQYIRGETQETRLAVEILKIRNANHSREMKPYDITDDGISVYQQANIF
ncbi:MULTISPECIES: KaiC domain-containing protein [Salinibaculum]|uniref:KaiC domain-containing protein n=1 Tax=Salinibaculum TaxID=2732368 RepID=UPI0030D493B8